MTRDQADQFEYDVAVSFASEDKAVAESFINLLKHKNIEVFRDEHTPADIWGKDVLDHLVNIYARKARYCVILISQNYPLKKWTQAERTSAQERSFRDPNEYILLIQLDDTEVPGIRETKTYSDLRQHPLESIVDLLEQKLTEVKARSGPPAKSHDLRSGNVPSTKDKSERFRRCGRRIVPAGDPARSALWIFVPGLDKICRSIPQRHIPTAAIRTLSRAFTPTDLFMKTGAGCLADPPYGFPFNCPSAPTHGLPSL